MAPAHLTLFPTQTTNIPRKSSLRTRHKKTPSAGGEIQLNGLAFQVNPLPKIQVAEETIQHTLFCRPPTTARFESPASVTTPILSPDASSNHGPMRRHSRTRRRSSPVMKPIGSPRANNSQEDSITELPENYHFGGGPALRRSLSARSERIKKPQPISTRSISAAPAEIISPSEYKDAECPLPTKTQFDSTVPRSERPISVSGSQVRSAGPISPMRSIFPQYDPSKPLSHQKYFPTSHVQSPPAYYSPVLSSVDSPPHRGQELRRYDSAVGLVDGYEHIPVAGHADLEALWKASIHDFPCEGRKVQFPVFQSSGSTSLAIGTSSEDTIYTLEKESASSELPKRYAVKKHCPTAPYSTPASRLVLPEKSKSRALVTQDSMEITSIFPQSAAIHAVETISTSPRAQAIATFDPTASSPAAARLAQEAVTRAHQDYACDLIPKSRKKDSANNVTASYILSNPHLGPCTITINPSVAASKQQTPGPRGQGKAKISFHHPTATAAAIAAETLNLASLDFGHEACVLDIPGLLALDSLWVIDTVISALVAVALIESERIKQEEITFEPPPTAPAAKGKKDRLEAVRVREVPHRAESTNSKKSSGFLARRREQREVKEIEPRQQLFAPVPEVGREKGKGKGEGNEEELPSFGRAVVGLVGLSLKGGFWVAKTGVKVVVKGVKMARASAAAGSDHSHSHA